VSADKRSLWIMAAALLAAMILAMTIGKFPLTGEQLANAWLGWAWGGDDLDPTIRTVIWNVRFPRVIAGLLIGASLAAAGATFQALFRNPLVAPDILGVSTGASLGAVLGIFLSLPLVAIQLTSFAGGILAVLAVYAVGLAIRHRDPVLTLVLAGVAISAIASAGISLIKILADPYDQLPTITYWLLGSLSSITRGDAFGILPAMVLGLVPLFVLRWQVNLLSLGDEEAKALGVDTRRLRPVLIAAATLVTAASVSIAGVIGWVGLVIPHIARLLVGPDFRRLLPASMLLGATFLLVVDIAARTLAMIEIPLGILTAVIGAPFFLWLLASGRRGWQ
jgi:iron complex transport system permease protein